MSPRPRRRIGPEQRRDFWAGARAIAPLMPGSVVFGLAVGALINLAGWPAWMGPYASATVSAGASQIAIIDALTQGAPAVIAILTALVINARLALYSASLAPVFAAFPTRWKPGAVLPDDRSVGGGVGAHPGRVARPGTAPLVHPGSLGSVHRRVDSRHRGGGDPRPRHPGRVANRIHRAADVHRGARACPAHPSRGRRHRHLDRRGAAAEGPAVRAERARGCHRGHRPRVVHPRTTHPSAQEADA
ncbi:AzlC family ABC transporter permease [Demequina litorisediminis]|uniref:AzlC family ABC transporter permease n=1 Tax=Demequina litorisediminis TaxID=1849022 RepID=UPI0024E099CF|nr:AzlC family ABC transporter permease [Demequina litorisediminis]